MSRWRRRVLLAAVAASFAGLPALLYVGVVRFRVVAEAKHSELAAADAIVVMGAAQFDGRPSAVLRGRLDRALALYRDGLGPLIVTTGSNQPGDRFTEGFVGFRYLREQGVPERDLVVVTTGQSTWQELSATAVELRRTGVRGRPRVILVSDAYHALRLQLTAREAGLTPGVAITAREPTSRELWRETWAVSVGKIIGFRRLSVIVN